MLQVLTITIDHARLISIGSIGVEAAPEQHIVSARDIGGMDANSASAGPAICSRTTQAGDEKKKKSYARLVE